MQSKHASLDKKEKWIDLFAVYENHGIVICCKNSCSETVMDLHTRKSDKRNHGFGLSSVKQIVEKYNGEYVIKNENNEFSFFYYYPIIICDHSLCPFSAKNVRFVHGLLILSIMFDKIIQKGRKRHGEKYS